MSENQFEQDKQNLHNQIDKLHEFHQHIDSKLVADILDLIVNDLYSLKKKLESKLK